MGYAPKMLHSKSYWIFLSIWMASLDLVRASPTQPIGISANSDNADHWLDTRLTLDIQAGTTTLDDVDVYAATLGATSMLAPEDYSGSSLRGFLYQGRVGLLNRWRQRQARPVCFD